MGCVFITGNHIPNLIQILNKINIYYVIREIFLNKYTVKVWYTKQIYLFSFISLNYTWCGIKNILNIIFIPLIYALKNDIL